MKYVMIFFSFLICSFNVNSQTIKKSDFIGKWYQYEKSDGKVIVLNRDNCRTISNYFESVAYDSIHVKEIKWDVNLISGLKINSEYGDQKKVKVNLNLKANQIILNDVIYSIENIKKDRFGDEIYSVTLVRLNYLRMYNRIKFQIDQLELLLSLDWIIIPIDSGFSVYYNNETNRRFQYKNRVEKQQLKKDIELWGIDYPNIRNDLYLNGEKACFAPDSVSWRCYLGLAYRYGVPTNEELRNDYPKNGILKIDVKFSDKWSQSHVDLVQSKNDILKKEILKEPLYKSNESIFDDYRYWIPLKINWGDRITKYDYYFERLPYESTIIDYSIFIYPNTPSCGEPVFVDDNDSLFFEKESNFLEGERKRTMRIIALSLGIKDC